METTCHACDKEIKDDKAVDIDEGYFCKECLSNPEDFWNEPKPYVVFDHRKIHKPPITEDE